MKNRLDRKQHVMWNQLCNRIWDRLNIQIYEELNDRMEIELIEQLHFRIYIPLDYQELHHFNSYFTFN